MYTLLVVLTSLTPSADHAGAVANAAADLCDGAKVPPFLRQDTRYFDFSDISPAQLEGRIRVFAGHVNQISRNAEIILPVRVTKTLVRVYIRDYGWRRETFESLKDVDPYMHTTLVGTAKRGMCWPGGVWPADGKYYPPGAFHTECQEGYTKRVGAVQLHSAQEVASLVAGKMRESDTAIGKLIEGTQSQVPILDAAWFFQQTVADFNRKPGYSDFLAFKDQKEFEKLLGFDEKGSRKFNGLWREAVGRSKVLRGGGARRIEVFSKPNGAIFRTKDSNRKADKRNPLRVVDDQLEFDATEQLGPLPNGMMGWGLFNSAGVKQDRAPDAVVGHQDGAANETVLHVCISCIECHTNAGVKEYQPWFRTLFTDPRGLESPDYDQTLLLRREYLTSLDDNAEDTRRIYTRAIFRATGLTAQQWSKEAWGWWKERAETVVDVQYAARSLGTSVALFQASLRHIKARTGIIDPVLATFLQPPALPIDLESWEEVFPIAHAYLRGFVP
jgi:hypothetical protein